MTVVDPSAEAGVLLNPQRAETCVAKARAIIETTKPGITRMVTITAIVGFIAAAVDRSWTTWSLVGSLGWCILGTALSSSGANALNQWWERARDARMARTAGRPLPRGAVEPGLVLACSLLMCVLGVGVLALANGPAAACVSLASITSYVLVYTPLKPITSFSTLVGAVPGALPPLIGWAAVTGTWQGLMMGGGWSLFGLMFVWQLPHFLAIAWMCREDYRLGGYKVLPVLDPSGVATSGAMLGTAILQIPATLLPMMTLDRLGLMYLLAALLTGAGYLWLSVRLARLRTRSAARVVFFASIAHLPLLLIALVLDLIWI
ncbi:MAG: protoheme IX farnesyltransferase [Phycisphaerales bacterium]|nr:protoheme IX farnesyltransferase [Phycisphaerales bacterium]